MPTEHQSHPLEVVETASGRYRLDTPATSVETDDPEELLAQIEKKVVEWDAAIAAAREKVERIMMRHVEQHLAPRRDVLKRLVQKYPAPQEWYDEPGWTFDAGEPLEVVCISTQIENPSPPEHVKLPWHRSRHARTGLDRPNVAKCNWTAEIHRSEVVEILGDAPAAEMWEISKILARLDSEKD